MSVMLLQPSKDACPVCGVAHPPEAPHNCQSLYYQQRFYGLRKRWPTWSDAVAHCTPEVQAFWKQELTLLQAWTEPEEGEPIADPPAESFHQPIDMSDVCGLRQIPLKRKNKHESQGPADHTSPDES